jgi:CheY-like chemotaxis protein
MKHVRAVRGLRLLPAVALSAYARRDDARRALEAGYQVHLAKPIEPSTLAQHIRRLAAGRRGERAATLPF